jgi:hypothetical protein
MKKPDPQLDWTIAEAEEQWQGRAETPSTAQPRRHNELILAALLALGLPLLIALWLWPRPTPAPSAAIYEATNHPSSAPEQTITRTIAMLDTAAQVTHIQQRGDQLMTQVIATIAADGQTRAYRQTRFYNQTGQGWQHSEVIPALLGPTQKLEIANFVIRYPAVDADAIYEAAPRLQQLDAALRHDLGLSADDAPYTIEVASTVQSFYNANLLTRQVAVSSPTLLSAPVEITPATLLYTSIVYPLARLMQSEWAAHHDARWQSTFARWYPLQNAFPLWELWQAGGPLAEGHQAILHWLYENGEQEGGVRAWPAEATALCNDYQIWQTQPSQIGIPLSCPAQGTAATPPQLPLNLAAIWRGQATRPLHNGESQAQPTADVLAVASLLDYVAVTYGRDKIPQLMGAMGEYTTVDRLIPTVLGISVDDFEVGWRSYLAQHN